MATETATYIDGLDSSKPTTGETPGEGDDHLRLIKSTIKATFPNVSGAVTPTHTELNVLNDLASGKIILGNSSNVAAAVTPSGDVTITDAGVTAIGSGVIVNADISASAAITSTKIALADGKILVGNGSGQADAVTMSGDVTLTNAGVAAIGTGVIVNADINGSAAIDATKIANGTVTSTEFQYLGDVTGLIQAQLNLKAPLASPALTGNPTVTAASGTGIAITTAASVASFTTTDSTCTGSWYTAGASGISISTTSNHPLFLGTNSTARIDISAGGDVALTGDQIGINNTQTPANAGATGVKGTICWDASYIYVCVDTNTWKRVAIATW